MTENPFQKYEENGTQTVWDASSSKTFGTCPRKYQYNNLMGLRPKDRSTSIKTDWGTAMHAAMETYWTQKFHGAEEHIATEAGIRTLWEWQERFSDETIKPAYSFHALIRAYVWYLERYKDDPATTVALPNGLPAVEVRFEVPIPGTSKRFSGRIDRIAEWGGSLYIFDLKTTGLTIDSGAKSSASYFKKYEPDQQVYSYHYAMQELGISVAGFVVDAVQTLVHSTKFHRHPVTVGPDQIEEWLEGERTKFKEADEYVASQSWPQRFSGCHGTYGTCEYAPICLRSRAYRPTTIAELYEKK